MHDIHWDSTRLTVDAIMRRGDDDVDRRVMILRMIGRR